MATNWSLFRKNAREDEEKLQESVQKSHEEAERIKKAPVEAGKRENERRRAEKQHKKSIKSLEKELKKYKGISDDDGKIIEFDKARVPSFSRNWNAVKNPYRDENEQRAWKEKTTIFSIKNKPETSKDSRTVFNHPRVVLLKSPQDKVEVIMNATTEKLAEDTRPEGQKPRLAIIGPNQEVEGVPVSVEKYLKATKSKSLAEDMHKQGDKSPVFESVYDTDNRGRMSYAATYLESTKTFYKEEKEPIQKEKEADKDKAAKKGKKQQIQEIAGRVVHNDRERLDIEGQLIRTNAYVYDQDMAEQSRTGAPVRDTTTITDVHNIKTQERLQLGKAKSGEELRKADPLKAPEKDLADKDMDGIPDEFEYNDENHNGVDDRYEPGENSSQSRDDYDPEYDDPNYEPADMLGQDWN